MRQRSTTTASRLGSLMLIFLLAFAVRAAFPDTSYAFWDESVYLLHGQLLAGQAVGYSEAFLRPPLLPLLLAPLAGLPFYELASRLFLAFLNSLVIFPLFFLTSRLFGRRQAFIAAVIVSLLPLHIINSRWILTDALGATLAFSAVASYIIGFQHGRKAMVYLGGILAGLAVLMKFTNLLLVPLLLPLFVLHRKRIEHIAVSLLLFAAVIAPYLAYSQLSFGIPFYTIQRAFHVVAESDPAGHGFFLYLLLDSLGMLLVFLALGVFSCLRRQQWGKAEAKLRIYLLYCLAVAAAYSFFIIGRGVSKPFGMEWEPERFLLLFALFAIPFISQGVSFFANSFLAILSRHLPGSISTRLGPLSFGIAAAATIVVALIFMHSQAIRSYTPSITFEDGLRSSSKEMGLYLKSSGISEFACLGNCPPVAYYSGKKLSVYYRAEALAAANHGSVVVFDSNVDALQPQYGVSKKICRGSHCAYILSVS